MQALRILALAGTIVWLAAPHGLGVGAEPVSHADAEPASSAWQRALSLIREDFPDVPQMTTARLAQLLGDEDAERIVLIDARTAEEFEVGHLRGAVRASGLRSALRALGPQAPQRTVVVYCSVGYRSSQVAERLRARGVANVFNLEGSLFKWANEGRHVYRGTERVTKVHPYDEDWGRLLDPRLWPPES